MMKYRYRNLKHVILHGIKPYGEAVFDKPLTGGGIELVEEINDKISKKTKNKINKLERRGD